FAHRLDRLADVARGDAGGAQLMARAELRKVLKGVLFGGGNEAGLLPCGKLAGPQMQNAEYVLTAVSGHRGLDRNRGACFLEVSMRREAECCKGLHGYLRENTWITRTK